MSDQIRNLTDGMKERRITASESFTDDVMSRIAFQKEGGFRSIPLPARILLSTILILVYCSLGILLGAKSYKNIGPEGDDSSEKAFVELMESHHINSDFIQDPMFRNLNSKN